jgi:hypothetical protein
MVLLVMLQTGNRLGHCSRDAWKRFPLSGEVTDLFAWNRPLTSAEKDTFITRSDF